jgi:tetratricopeptide (TPR) repeat protein
VSIFLFWLLWIAGFAVFTATRFLILLFTTPAFRRKYLPATIVYSLVGTFALGGGILQLQSLTPSAQTQSIGPLGIFVIFCLLVAITIQLIRDTFGATVRGLATKGNRLVRLSKYADALTAYDRALIGARWYPNNQVRANIRIGRAGALLALGRYDEALAACDQALALAPALALAWTLKGAVLTNQLRYSEAIPIYEHALTLTATDPQLWALMAYALERADRTDDALAASEKALQLAAAPGLTTPAPLATTPPPTWLLFAWIAHARALNTLDRSDEALTAAERGVEQFPHFAAMQLTKAQVLTRLHRADEAQATAAEAVHAADQQLAKLPHVVPVLVAKANALRLLGHDTEAEAIEAQVRALLPNLTIVDGRAV